MSARSTRQREPGRGCAGETDVDASVPTSVIRVAVALPALGDLEFKPSDASLDGAEATETGIARRRAPDASSARPLSARTLSVETTAALARLGDPVEILRAETLDELRRQIRDEALDLVLLDRLDPRVQSTWLSTLAKSAEAVPPSVVVVDETAEEAALEAFRSGASDCVRFGPDYGDVLPVVLLEQVRRWRADRRRRLSEQRIEWLERLYSGIVAAMPAALAVVDDEGLIVAVNPEFERLFPDPLGVGATPDDALQGDPRVTANGAQFIETRLPRELVDALSSPSTRSDDSVREIGIAVPPPERASATGTEPAARLVQIEGASSDAPTRSYELRVRSLDGDGRQILLISDVTESEWLNSRVARLRRDNRDIIENLGSALLVVDPEGTIHFANPAAASILGEEESTLQGRRVGDWFGRGDAGASPIEACLLYGDRSRGAETLVRRSDGQWIPVGISCSPRIEMGAEGEDAEETRHARHGVVAVFQDLSEIKELELQVRQTEKMASIGQLAAGVAHEVNNPMGFIHANLHQMSEYLTGLERHFAATEKLQETIAEGDLEAICAAAADVDSIGREIDLGFVRSDFAKALSESSEGAERIRHIVRDLRDFSRPDLPERSPADINQALESTANIVWAMMKSDVHLERDYGDLPKVDGYPMQLKQVFMNLLVNGYQAIEEREDGVPGVMRIETRHEGAEVVIRISDSGIGISEHDQERIFEPFFTTKPVGTGTGLGLSTSYTIIERHGGRMLVSSEPQAGTTFEIRLPLSMAPAAEKG